MAGSQPLALVVDDEPDICELLTMTLSRMDVRTDIAMSVTEAKRRLAEKQYDFCLTDMRLPDGDGLELVKDIQQRPLDRALPVAVITAHGNMDTAVAALKLGAFDFVSKPINLKPLRALVQLALRLGEEKRSPQTEWHALLQGQTLETRKLQEHIEQLSRTDAPIHIRGEHGAGKELAAREIHRFSPRSSAPFVVVNCSAEDPAELEHSLFGNHTEGPESGPLMAANGGTLYLDDITELPEALQAKLLQCIQNKKIYSPSANREHALDLRIISATHKSLVDAATAHRIRSDLYFRLNVIELVVPPLRERQKDIPMLARSVLREVAASSGNPTPRITQDALNTLQNYSFPANLRQLENILQRAFALCDGRTIRPEDLQLDPVSAKLHENSGLMEEADGVRLGGNDMYPGQFSSSTFESLDEFLQDIEKKALEKALEETRWNRTAAAQKLGISFRSLRYRLKKLDMED
ncbi:sigma-54-dependent transcriptional regulator [Microbulbifer celer]|uniref:Sigma-54-dependent transcriptional regulator n=1 Tax=Microbulbifer celer TaxID=435905 RepID=A0ABW3UAT5_9GAMM|nr:sigma-54 dependent transcriptional regulator [Microbulbifer celer]UFN56229.1 sigma-54 dependent transcriptional regulator [Microbulbifer celer]